MPVNVNFPAFTDEDILFETMDDANAFFAQISVPNATEVSYGVVKKGAAVTPDFTDIASAFVIQGLRTEVLMDNGVDKEYFISAKKDDTETALNDLRTALVSLKNSLVAAGLIAS